MFSFILYFTFILFPPSIAADSLIPPYSFNYPLKAIGRGVYTAFTASTAQRDINGACVQEDLVFGGQRERKKTRNQNGKKQKKK